MLLWNWYITTRLNLLGKLGIKALLCNTLNCQVPTDKTVNNNKSNEGKAKLASLTCPPNNQLSWGITRESMTLYQRSYYMGNELQQYVNEAKSGEIPESTKGR